MAKITITLDTDSKQVNMDVNGVNYDVNSVHIHRYNDGGFDFCAEQKPVVGDGITNHSSIVAYAAEFKTKSFAKIQFLDEAQTVAKVEESKIQEKFAEWIQANVK